MRFLFIGLLLMLPVLAWGATKNAAQQNELQEDICFAFTEYAEARNEFHRSGAGAGYRPSSPQGSIAREKDLKESRLIQLQERYFKKVGKRFDVLQNPDLCYGKRP